MNVSRNQLGKNSIMLLCCMLAVALVEGKGRKFFHFQQDTTIGNEKISVAGSDSLMDVPFGKKEKKLVSSSISSISGEKIRQFPVQRLDQALSGMIPGLTVINNGVEPGRESSILRVRGQHSFQNNEPLIFVDGFEASMDQLSVYEIDKISVFKDAASLAPFGVRGANGVIWVTTKRGKGDKMTIELNTRTGISKPMGLPNFVNSFDYARLYNEALSNDLGVWSPRYSEQDLQKYKDGSDPLFHPNVDWYKEVMKDYTINNETALSFHGTVSKMRYFVMLGYLSTPKFYKSSDEEGNLADKSSTRRYNFRTNVDVDINKIFDASISIGGAVFDNARPNVSNIWGDISLTPPNAYLPKNPDGSWSGNATYPNNPAGSVLALGRLSYHDRRLQSLFTLREKMDFLLPGLSLKQSFGFDNMNSVTYNVTGNYARYSPVKDNITGDTTYTQFGNSTPYTASQASPSQMWRTSFQVGADYIKQMGKHSITANLNYRYSQLFLFVESPAYNDIVLSGNVSYNYNKKYFAELTAAYSGSENFAPGNRFGLFPALSAGWNMKEEKFMENADWIDYLKVKASVGVVGNSDIGAWRFLYQSYFPAGSNYILGNSGTRSVSTLVEGVVANPDVTWEESTIFNFGIEGNFFRNRLAIGADLFSEKRNGILAQKDATTPGIIGIGLPYENIGKVDNKGFEFSLDWNDDGGKLKYGISAVFSMARNKIVYQDEIVRREDYLYRTGKRLGQVFGLEALGLFQSEDEISNAPIHTFSPVKPGDIRYKDQNDDGLINEDDMIAMGYTNNIPEITGSLGGRLGYKGFDMNFVFTGMGNRSMYVAGNNIWAFRGNGQAPDIALNRWVYYPGQGLDTRSTATYPRLSASTNLNNERLSTYWLKDGGFIRLSNVEFGYTIPVSEKSNISNFRVYISGMNLLTFSKTGDWDPVALVGTYPISRSVFLGVNIGL